MPRAGGDISRLPYLRIWLRTRSAIILHLSCGILQVCIITTETIRVDIIRYKVVHSHLL